jgi:hypothetical protein
VLDDETLARFVVVRQWVRADRTLRPDAFIPYPWPNLSVTRRSVLSEEMLVTLGEAVARARDKPLLGHAQLEASIPRRASLEVLPDPLPENPLHANITGWPAEKPHQKMIALTLAASARFVAKQT